MERLKSIIQNPKILLISFLFLIVPVMIILLALFKTTKRPEPRKTFATPTPIQLEEPKKEVPAPNIQTPPNLLINRLRDVSFQISGGSFPTQLKLYKTTPRPIESQKANSIAASLTFKKEPEKRISQTDTVLVWQDGLRQLIVHLETGTVEFFNPQSSSSLIINSPQEAMIKASDFLKTFNPYSESLSPDPQNISYYLSSPGDLKKTKNFEEADTFDIPFIQKVDNLPVYAQFGSSARAHAWVNKTGNIVRVSLRTQEIPLAEGTGQIISFDEAKKKIIEGEGTIVLYGEEYQGEPLPPPIKTTFASALLAYLKDSLNNSLYPIFVFSGIALVNDTEIKIMAYLPALK